MRWIFPAIFGAAFFSFIASFVIVRVAKKAKAVRFPGGRHEHKQPVPLWGGIAIAIAFLVGVLIYPELVLTSKIIAIVIGFLVLVVMGMIDDVRSLPWWVELMGQGLAAAFVVLGGASLEYVNNPFGGAIDLSVIRIANPFLECGEASCTIPVLGALVTTVWILGVINAFNWFDGSDGVASTIGLLALSALALLSLRADIMQPAIAILAALVAGGILGLLPFNLPPAKLFLGTSGAMGIGFLIASFAVVAGAKVATAGLALVLPAADMAFVLFLRLREKAPLVLPDTRHFHFWLKQKGWGDWSVMIFFAGTSFLFAVAAIFLPVYLKALVLAVGFGVLLLWFLKTRL